jgi:hypothetical protein
MSLLDPSLLSAGESYATVEQIRDVTDRAQMPVAVPQWQHADGTPFKLLLRAPSFRQRTEIHRASRNAKGEDDDDAFVLETCLRGIAEPQLTRPQLEILQDRNPEVLDSLCETIWWLARIPAKALESEVRRLSDLPPADDPGESAE